MVQRISPRSLPRLVLAVCCVAAAGDAQRTTVELHNVSSFPRIEWARASVPFARGAQREPIQRNAGSRPTAWRTLQRWPDGSVKVAQAQFLAALAPWQSKSIELRKGRIDPQPFALHADVRKALDRFAVATVVRDSDGVPYYAVFRPQSNARVLEATPACITVRARSYHRAAPRAGIGRDFLSQTVYATWFSGLPYAVIDVVVANDYLGSDTPRSNDPNEHALGDVAFDSLDLYVIGAEGIVQHAGKNATGPHVPDVAGKPSTWVRLLSKTYLSDAQGKRWRLVVSFGEHPLYKLSARALADETLIPLVDRATWQRSGAFGVHGGPIAGPRDIVAYSVETWRRWRTKPQFGPFGTWGDFKSSQVTGTHRNGPVTDQAIEAVQSGTPFSLLVLEGKAWQQTLRPYQLWNLRVEPKDDIYLYDGLPYGLSSHRRVSQETLGRYALQKHDPFKHWRQGVRLGASHGWNAYDVEHFSADILFDYWTFTGDWRALDEIRTLGECAMGATRAFKYNSSHGPMSPRAEGWLALGLVKAWLATGGDRYKNHLLHRIHTNIEPKRRKSHPSKAIQFEPSHPLTHYPTPNEYMMPWQHAAIIYGYLPCWTLWHDNDARTIAHDVVQTIVYAWVKDYNDPFFGFVPDGIRYYVPISYQHKPVKPDIWDYTKGIGVRYGDSPLGGAHSFFAGGLDLLRDDSRFKAEHDLILWIRKKMKPAAYLKDSWRRSRWGFLREQPR